MGLLVLFICVDLLIVLGCVTPITGKLRTFAVDYGANTFVKDGQPFRYISGSMHYFRVPQIYWRDRVHKMKACGLDAVETYIPWNFHSLSEGNYNFDGQRDISRFLEIVNEEGLLAIIRGFPYCDTEWDMGGLPSWLLKSDHNPPSNRMKLRSSDSRFLSSMTGWLDHVMDILKLHSYGRGGPIILFQIENEYGSYPYHDYNYLKFLRDDLSRRMDDENVVFFTTDGNSKSDLQRGHIDDVLQTVDFGPGSSVSDSFKLLRSFLPQGPLVNSEFYTGWLDHWGESHHRTSSHKICSSLDKILSFNASVNFYMFVGGTNFEYWSGSNGLPIQQIITSYDYDSPISEDGDTTEKYFAIRQIISKYKTVPPLPAPRNITKLSYGSIGLLNKGPIWEHLDTLSSRGPVKNHLPLSFEDLSVIGGFVIYRTIIQETPVEPVSLKVLNSVRDYGRVYLNSIYIGNLTRASSDLYFNHSCKQGDRIDIIVESYGRICYGHANNDSKGIDGPVQLVGAHGSSISLTEWEMWNIDLQHLNDTLPQSRDQHTTNTPTIFTSWPFRLDPIADTFISLPSDSWSSGYVIANGFNHGKYNVIGPQKTLFLPLKSISDSDMFQISIFDTNPPKACSTVGDYCFIWLIDHPVLG